MVPSLASSLARLRSSIRRAALREAAACLSAASFLYFALSLALDYSLRLPAEHRGAALLAFAGGAGYLVYRKAWRPARFPLPPATLALLAERRFPALQGRLVTAVEGAGGASCASPELLEQTIAHAVKEAERLPWRAALDLSRPRRLARFAGAGIAAALIFAAADPSSAAVWASRNLLLRPAPWPRKTELQVFPENPRVVHGGTLAVRVVAVRGSPGRVRLRHDRGGRAAAENLPRRGREFVFSFEEVFEPFRFRVQGGDYESEEIAVEVAVPPRVADLRLRVAPPRYTGEAERWVKPFEGPVEAVAGTKVELLAQANVPVARGAVRWSSGAQTPLTIEGANGRAAFEVKGRDEGSLTVEDGAGLASDPVTFVVAGRPDRPPAFAAFEAPGAGRVLTPEAVLDLRYEVEDDLGLAEIVSRRDAARAGEAAVSTSGRPPSGRPGERRWAQAWSEEVSAWNVRPGDRVTIFLEAKDANDATGPGVGRSPVLSFRIADRAEVEIDVARRLAAAGERARAMKEQEERLRAETKEAAAMGAQGKASLGELARRQEEVEKAAARTEEEIRRGLKELEVNRAGRAEQSAAVEEKALRPLAEAGAAMREAREALAAAAKGGQADAAGIEARQKAAAEGLQRAAEALSEKDEFQDLLRGLQEVILNEGKIGEAARLRKKKEIEELLK